MACATRSIRHSAAEERIPAVPGHNQPLSDIGFGTIAGCALTLSGPEATGSAAFPLVLVAAGYFARIQGDFVQAVALDEEALAAARASGNTNAMGSALFSLGLVALDQGELDRARAHHQAALIPIGRRAMTTA
jgi:hypothetical protein